MSPSSIKGINSFTKKYSKMNDGCVHQKPIPSRVGGVEDEIVLAQRTLRLEKRLDRMDVKMELAWRKVPPKAGESTSKTFEGRDYEYCATCNYWTSRKMRMHKTGDHFYKNKVKAASESTGGSSGDNTSGGSSGGSSGDSTGGSIGVGHMAAISRDSGFVTSETASTDDAASTGGAISLPQSPEMSGLRRLRGGGFYGFHTKCSDVHIETVSVKRAVFEDDESVEATDDEDDFEVFIEAVDDDDDQNGGSGPWCTKVDDSKNAHLYDDDDDQNRGSGPWRTKVDDGEDTGLYQDIFECPKEDGQDKSYIPTEDRSNNNDDLAEFLDCTDDVQDFYHAGCFRV